MATSVSPFLPKFTPTFYPPDPASDTSASGIQHRALCWLFVLRKSWAYPKNFLKNSFWDTSKGSAMAWAMLPFASCLQCPPSFQMTKGPPSGHSETSYRTRPANTWAVMAWLKQSKEDHFSKLNFFILRLLSIHVQLYETIRMVSCALHSVCPNGSTLQN